MKKSDDGTIPNDTIVDFIIDDLSAEDHHTKFTLGIIMGWCPGDFCPIYTIMDLHTRHFHERTDDQFTVSGLDLEEMVRI